MMNLVLTIIALVISLSFLYLLVKMLPKVETEPFGLPKGTVRSILAFLIILPIPVCLTYALISDKSVNLPEAYWGIVGSIIGFYFGFRSKS